MYHKLQGIGYCGCQEDIAEVDMESDAEEAGTDGAPDHIRASQDGSTPTAAAVIRYMITYYLLETCVLRHACFCLTSSVCNCTSSWLFQFEAQ